MLEVPNAEEAYMHEITKSRYNEHPKNRALEITKPRKHETQKTLNPERASVQNPGGTIARSSEIVIILIS